MGRDPYLDDTCRWWHLTDPSPELRAAQADGWLGPVGVVVDVGCGLGTEAGYLASAGWSAIGVDLSAAALYAATSAHPGVTFVRADALSLPLRDACADLLLDRGCFHYVAHADRPRYAQEARRILRPGGRFLIRACRSAAGVPNDIDGSLIRRVFGDWRLDRVTTEDIPSDTRRMPAIIARLNRA